MQHNLMMVVRKGDKMESALDLIDRPEELKAALRSCFLQGKKLRALENFAEVSTFFHRDYVALLKRCLAQGFLAKEEEAFLNHMLSKYELNYLDWCHWTKWLKQEMSTRARARDHAMRQNVKSQQPTLFPVDSELLHPTCAPVAHTSRQRATA